MTNFEENLIEKTNCPICSGGSKTIDTCKTINHESELTLSLMECLVCKHWWNNPALNQNFLSDLYKRSSLFVVSSDAQEMLSANDHSYLLDEECYKSLLPYSNSLSSGGDFNYFEIGVGSGHLFNYFKQKAKTSFGVDPGEWGVQKEHNIFPDINMVPNNVKFDVVIARDVLEHLSDPVAMIRKLKGMVNNNCIVHCTFPNKDSLKAKILKGKWGMIRPFGHLHYFSAASIKILFEKSGFDVLKIKNIRIGNMNVIEEIKSFNYSRKKLFFRFIKNLLLGQILLGKDQWWVVARFKE